MTRKEAAAYLAAMVDGEGTVSVAKGPRPYRAVRITNTDPDLIEATCECCRRLDITYNVQTKNEADAKRSKCWVVTITNRASIEKVAKLPLRASSKRWRLGKLISSYTGG